MELSGAVGGTAAAFVAFSVARCRSAASNRCWLIRPISAWSHSDPLVMQMESSNSPPIHEGLGMLARFSLNKLNRAVSSTFVGLVLSWKHFLQASTSWMKVSMRSVVLAVAVDMILVGVGVGVGSACRNGESREGTFYLFTVASVNKLRYDVSNACRNFDVVCRRELFIYLRSRR